MAVSDEQEKKPQAEEGSSAAAQRLSKEELLKRHAAAINEQNKAPKASEHMVIPRGVKRPDLSNPYPASTKSIRELEKIPLRSLKPGTHHWGQALVVRAAALPYSGAGTVTVVEDAAGDADRLIVFAHSDSSILSNIPEGCFVAVKEPFYRLETANPYHQRGDPKDRTTAFISVDHPSDILLLRFHDPDIPASLKESAEQHPLLSSLEEWRTAGDASFLQQDLATAVFCYTEALDYLKPGEEGQTDLRAAILAKRAGTNLLLGRYDAAKEDALESVNQGPQDWRAYQTAAKACYALADFRSALSILDRALKLTDSPQQGPSASGIKGLEKERDKVRERIREEDEGCFDFPALAKTVGPKLVHLDVANFTRRTVVRGSKTHGRGLFAAEDIPAGELVFVEKATVMPNQYDEQKSSAALYAVTVRRTYDCPTLARRLAPLWAGESYKYPPVDADSDSDSDEDGLKIVVDGVPVVDVFRTEMARTRNCFSAPYTTLARTQEKSSQQQHRHHHGGEASPNQAKGLWPYAANMNHACAANTMRAFVGDVMITRASRPIVKGEEITQQYVPVKSDPKNRQTQFREWWKFECACSLCGVELAAADKNPERYTKRIDTLKAIERTASKAAKALEKEGPGPNSKIVPEATMRTVDKLAKLLEEAHEESVYGDNEGANKDGVLLPRLLLVFPSLWLLDAHRAKQHHAKVIQQAHKVLRNFGFAIPKDNDDDDVSSSVEQAVSSLSLKNGKPTSEEGRKITPPPRNDGAARMTTQTATPAEAAAVGMATLFQTLPPSSRAVMTTHVVRALKHAAEAHRALGDVRRAERYGAAAQFGYMMATGWENDVSDLAVD